MAVIRHCRSLNNDLALGSRSIPLTGAADLPRMVGGCGDQMPNWLMYRWETPEIELAHGLICHVHHRIRRVRSTGLITVNMAG